MMIYVVATVTVKPGRRQDFLAELHTVSTAVRNEAGCLEYQAAVDVASGIERQDALRQDVVIVLERWRDLPSLWAHGDAAHMRAFREKCKELILSSVLQVLEASAASFT